LTVRKIMERVTIEFDNNEAITFDVVPPRFIDGWNGTIYIYRKTYVFAVLEGTTKGKGTKAFEIANCRPLVKALDSLIKRCGKQGKTPDESVVDACVSLKEMIVVTEVTEEQTCSNCGKKGDTSGSMLEGQKGLKLSKCGGCQSLYYCSQHCAKEHWKVHKKDCRTCERGLAIDPGHIILQDKNYEDFQCLFEFVMEGTTAPVTKHKLFKQGDGWYCPNDVSQKYYFLN
jgi:hypothetical protein